MEIRFSKFKGLLAGPLTIEGTARSVGVKPVVISSYTDSSVRFNLPAATVQEHDNVIRALLTLDPDATVRTARAVYEGLEDFVRQCEARTNAPLAGAKMQRGK